MLTRRAMNTRDALRAASAKGCLEAVRFLVEEGVPKEEDTETKEETLLRCLHRKTIICL